MAMRTLSRRVALYVQMQGYGAGIALNGCGSGSREILRPWLRLWLQFNVPTVSAPALTLGKRSSYGGSDCSSNYLDSGNFGTAPAPTTDPGKHTGSRFGYDRSISASPAAALGKMFRLRRFPLRPQPRIAGQGVLPSRDDAEWPRGH